MSDLHETGWLRIAPNDFVQLESEPPTGPYFVGRHLLNERWRWYEAGQLWGPSCRWAWLCRFRKWRSYE